MKRGKCLFMGLLLWCLLICFAIYHRTTQNRRVDCNIDKTSRDTLLCHDVMVSIEESDTVLIPEDNILKRMTKKNLIRLYEKYTNSLQILCRNIQRTGSIYDGGKEVCVDMNIVPKDPCLVYSFGSANRFDFEVQVIKMFRCKVITFDPSLKNLNLKLRNPHGCSFYHIGLAGKDEVNSKGWTLKTFASITDMLNHTERIIDVVKIDTEFAEWETIPQMIQAGSLNNIKQILVEFHFDVGNDISKMARRLAVFRGLYNAGFRIFSKERNTYCKSCYEWLEGRQIVMMVELSLVNTRFISKP